jgi:hypothetical protein
MKTNCLTWGCRNPRVHQRTICHRCKMRKWRARNPMRSAYRALRDHAVARGIEFTISYEEFREFALHSEYIEKKGPGGCHLTVDRVDNTLGYLPNNIQPMTRSENSVKMAKYDAIRLRQGYSMEAHH